MSDWRPHPRHPNATPPAPNAAVTPLEVIDAECDRIDGIAAPASHTGDTLRRITRTIRQAARDLDQQATIAHEMLLEELEKDTD